METRELLMDFMEYLIDPNTIDDGVDYTTDVDNFLKNYNIEKKVNERPNNLVKVQAVQDDSGHFKLLSK